MDSRQVTVQKYFRDNCYSQQQFDRWEAHRTLLFSLTNMVWGVAVLVDDLSTERVFMCLTYPIQGFAEYVGHRQADRVCGGDLSNPVAIESICAIQEDAPKVCLLRVYPCCVRIFLRWPELLAKFRQVQRSGNQTRSFVN